MTPDEKTIVDTPFTSVGVSVIIAKPKNKKWKAKNFYAMKKSQAEGGYSRLNDHKYPAFPSAEEAYNFLQNVADEQGSNELGMTPTQYESTDTRVYYVKDSRGNSVGVDTYDAISGEWRSLRRTMSVEFENAWGVGMTQQESEKNAMVAAAIIGEEQATQKNEEENER